MSICVTATDASYASGRPGLTIYLDAGGTVSQVQLDNFSAGSLSGGGTFRHPDRRKHHAGNLFPLRLEQWLQATSYHLLEDPTGTGTFRRSEAI